MFERFSDGARRAVAYAQEESRLLRHQHIGTEHLLLGLLYDDTAVALALDRLGVTPDRVRRRVVAERGRGRRKQRGHVPFTQEVLAVLERAGGHAERLGHARIHRAHLLRALLDDPATLAARTLVGLAGTAELVADRADALARAAAPPAPTGRPSPQPGRRPPAKRRPRRLPLLLGEPSGEDVSAQLADLDRHVTALTGALLRYGRHDAGCAGDRRCSCGLARTLDALAPPRQP